MQANARIAGSSSSQNLSNDPRVLQSPSSAIPIPIPMFLSRMDDNQSELGDAVRRLGDRIGDLLGPAAPQSPDKNTCSSQNPPQSALTDRLANFSMRQATLIGVVNDIIARLEI